MTTAEAFAEAARAYARERYPSGSDLDRDRRMVVDEFTEWARTHLAAQEPTEGEVRAGAHEIHVLRARLAGDPVSSHTLFDEDLARAALSAARAARRDEENR